MSTYAKIITNLWFDHEAEEAARFYVSLFPNSRVTDVIPAAADTPSGPAGDTLEVSFELAGQSFVGVNGGPAFRFNPSVSMFVNCDTVSEVDVLFERLAEGGMVLMPLQAYPFSERFAWVQDRYGLSWQINAGSRAQKITPALMFVGDQYGRAEEAIRYYMTVFGDSRIEQIEHYGEGVDDNKPGTVMQALFSLHGTEFRAMDSGYAHEFAFNEAISFMITCETQDEIDRYWKALSAHPENEQCGWLKDRFGVSWQVTPTILLDMLTSTDREAARRVTEAFLPMKKLELEPLRRAFAGE